MFEQTLNNSYLIDFILAKQEKCAHPTGMREFLDEKYVCSIEYNIISGLPTSGLPVGKIFSNEHEINAYFPYDPNTKNLDSLIFQSFFVTGVMGLWKN